MGLNCRSKHIELRHLWHKDNDKNVVIKVKKASSENQPAGALRQEPSLRKHLSANGLRGLQGHLSRSLSEKEGTTTTAAA